MIRAGALVFFATLHLSQPATGETVREIGVPELRQLVSDGQTMSLKRAIAAVVTTTGGTALEARAFQADDVLYRIVLKKPDGTLVSVIINARTGAEVTKGSAVGQQIVAAARTRSGKPGTTNNGKADTAGKAANDQSDGGRGNNGNGGGGNGGGGNSGNGGGNGNGNGKDKN